MGRSLRAFAIYVAAIFALAGLTAYPLSLALASVGFTELPFRKLVFWLLKIFALLGLWPLLYMSGLNAARHWGFGRGAQTRAGGALGLFAGFGAGVLMMSMLVACLFALDVRVLKPDIVWSATFVATVVAKGLFTGLAVAFFEELWFRGALFSLFEQMAGLGAAILVTALLYAGVHFIRADVEVAAGQLDWRGGFEVISNAFHRFRNVGIVDSLAALFAAGVLLALVRARTGRIAECIGVHAGWVLVIVCTRKLSSVDAEGVFAFAVGHYDGVIGTLALAWLGLIALLYHRFSARAVDASSAKLERLKDSG